MSRLFAPAAFRAATLAGVLLAAGCTDRLPSAPAETPGPDAHTTQIQCSVQVSTAQVSCAAPAPAGGASRSLTLGGQGTYVRLANTPPTYDGTSVFQLDVTVQNLTGGLLGTSDGSTVSGVRVFFASGPSVSGGTGTVEVANPDGQALFLGSEQPFFQYAEILEPRGTSAPRPWRFTVPSTVTSFGFTVYVRAEAPAEAGTLRWLREQGTTAGGAALRDVWAASPTQVFAVGDDGAVSQFDGTRWSGLPTPTRHDLMGVWGTSARNVYAVGDSGLVIRYDGNRWSTVRSGFPTEMLQEIWGSSPTDVWVAGLRETDPGTGAEERLLLHFDGTQWTEVATVTGGGGALYGVWGTGPADVYVAGEEWNPGTGRFDGVVRHFDGTAWSRVAGVSGGVLAGIWGSGADDVYVVGTQRNAGTGARDGVILHFDGTTWTPTASAAAAADHNRVLADVWGTGTGAVHVVGVDFVPGSLGAESDAVTLVSAGAGWTATVRADEGQLESVGGTGAGNVFAVGFAGGVLRFDGTAWTRQQGDAVNSEVALRGVWGTSTAQFAVGQREWTEGSVIATSSGGAWSFVTHPATSRLSAVWGRSASQIFAVGTSVLRFNGSSWVTDAVSATNVTEIDLQGVWGGATGAVYAVGSGMNATTFEPRGVMLSSGGTGSWSLVGSIPSAGRGFHAVWGTSGSNIFVVGCSGEQATILRWTGTWSETVVPGAGRCLRAVWGSAANDVYAAGDGGLLMRFDGSAWSTVSTGTAADLRAVWGSAASDVYVSGDGGTLLRFNGTAWHRVNSGTAATLRALWGRSATDVYAVGDGMTVLHGVR